MALTVLRFQPGQVLPRTVYLDTNILLYARDRDSPKYRAASSCLSELVRQDAALYTSTLVFDELWWALLRTSHRLATGRTLTASAYKQDPGIWRDTWPRIRRITAEITAWPRLRILDVASGARVVEDASALIDASPLAPRDAFHLAIALANDVSGLATADPDFESAVVSERQLTIVRL